MVLRLSAAVMFIAAGTLYGFIRSGRLKNGLVICRETGELMRRAEIMIRSSGMNVYELARALKESNELTSLSFLSFLPEEFSPYVSFCSYWKKAVYKQYDLPDEERDLLLRLGGIIGSYDTEGQTAAIEALLSELGFVEKKRSEELIKKGRLYRSVGTLFGITVGILIL